MSTTSLRQTVFENPYFRTALLAGAVVVIVAFLIFQSHGRSVPSASSQTFFSVDDGKTWFADDARKIPPFDKNGKPAVRAFVYRCADGTTFVNHLQRFKPDAKRVLEEPSAPDPAHKGGIDLSGIKKDALASGREVKRPGDAKWIDGGDFRAAAQILAVKCPQGHSDAQPLEP
jgi:hypothetical protein